MDDMLFTRLKEISNRLKERYRAEKVILYGSCARGEATKDSDIDLFIIAPTRERFFERMATAVKIIRDLRKGLAIEPIVLTAEEVEERIGFGDPFVREIVDEGIYL